MARGNAKANAQEKNAKKNAGKKEAKSDLKARAAAFKASCPICAAQLITYNMMKVHYEAKHPKETCPPPPES